MLVCEDREAMVMAPPPTHDSAASPCFHDCLAFFHRHFLLQFHPSHPLNPFSAVNSSPHPGIAPQSLHSSSQPPSLPVPASLSGCVWFSFHLGCYRSAISLSALNVSPLTQTTALMWGSDPCFTFPPTKGRSSPCNTPVFPSSSSILPSFAWFYIFFSAAQLLLSALSWYSACTSVSEGVFLMYLWREYLLLCHLVF